MSLFQVNLLLEKVARTNAAISTVAVLQKWLTPQTIAALSTGYVTLTKCSIKILECVTRVNRQHSWIHSKIVALQ